MFKFPFQRLKLKKTPSQAQKDLHWHQTRGVPDTVKHLNRSFHFIRHQRVMEHTKIRSQRHWKTGFILQNNLLLKKDMKTKIFSLNEVETVCISPKELCPSINLYNSLKSIRACCIIPVSQASARTQLKMEKRQKWSTTDAEGGKLREYQELISIKF